MGGGSFIEFIPDTLSIALFEGTVVITFQYRESTYDFTDGVSCFINGLIATVSSSSGTGGNGTASLSIVGDNAKFFTQGYTQIYQLTYNFIPSETITYNWTHAIDGNNINLATSGSAFTAVDISSQSKSILLPPVASKPGYIYRFKITNYASPNLLRISPYFTGFDNTTGLKSGAANYDSSIDGASSTIRLEGQNYSIALVSDGTNWSIITLYVSSLLTPSRSSISGSSTTETNPTQILYYRSSSVANLILAPMDYSFIKYVSILNQGSSSGTFNIFFPAGKKVDNVTASVVQTIKVPLTIPGNSLGTIILTYANSQYYILGYYIFGTGDNITNNTTSSNGNRLTKGMIFSNTEITSTVTLEVPSTIATTNYSVISILKMNNNTSYVATVKINKPRDQSNSYFAITNTTTTKQLSIALTPGASNYRYTCIWLAKYYDSTYGTIILPVHYYLATSAGGGISP
jgi:hypothetical protein